MLLRMYVRWAETKKFKVETLDMLHGDEAEQAIVEQHDLDRQAQLREAAISAVMW